MRVSEKDSLTGKISALELGMSLAVEHRRLNAVQLAVTRAIQRTGKEYHIRVEGKGKGGAKQRVAVYCGPLPANVVTGMNGVRRIRPVAHLKNSAIFQTHCGFREVPDKYSGAELAEAVERGWQTFCRKRGWNPQWT